MKKIVLAVSILACAMIFANCSSNNSPATPNDIMIKEFQTGISPNPLYNGVSMTYIDEAYPDTTYETSTSGGVGVYLTKKRRTLVLFDLTTLIPKNVTVVKAYLTFFYATSGTFANFKAYKVTSYFSPFATWNQSDYSYTDWTTAGGDYATTAVSDDGIYQLYNNYVTISLDTAMVSGWLKDAATNKGLLIKADNETTEAMTYLYTVNNGNMAITPKLTIYYRLP